MLRKQSLFAPQPQSHDSLETLPNEIKLLIFSMLDTPRELTIASQVCQDWNQIISANQHSLWKKHLGSFTQKEAAILMARNLIKAQDFFNTLYSSTRSLIDQRFNMPARVGLLTLDSAKQNAIFQLSQANNSSRDSKPISVHDSYLMIFNLKKLDALNHLSNIKAVLIYVSKQEEIDLIKESVLNNKHLTNSLLLFVTHEANANTLRIPPILTLTLKNDDTEFSFYDRLLKKIHAIASFSILKDTDNLEERDVLRTRCQQLLEILDLAKYKPELENIVPAVKNILGY